MTLTDGVFLLVAALTTGVIAWSVVPWARRSGLVDIPSGRHDHAAPTPVVGGVAILLAVAGLGLARGGGGSPAFLAWIAAGVLLVGIGVIDDRRDLPWRVRVLAQAGAALILYAGGAYAQSVGDLLSLGPFALPFSVFATVGVINAVNMIDGSDGLAGSLIGVTLAVFALEAVQAGERSLATQLLLMLGAVIGFLALNLRYPGQRAARIFLGNSGSALLGMTVAWAAFGLARVPGHASAGILAPWAAAVPLIDCVVLMGRRLWQGRSPFQADRDHIHHLLRDAGHSAQAIVGMAVLASLGCVAFAELWLRAGWPQLPLVLIYLGLIATHFAWSGRRERAVAQLRRRPRVAAAVSYDDGEAPTAGRLHD